MDQKSLTPWSMIFFLIKRVKRLEQNVRTRFFDFIKFLSKIMLFYFLFHFILESPPNIGAYEKKSLNLNFKF